jgi:putative endonuclease
MDTPVTTRARGVLGEDLARSFLEFRGYTILERNLRVGGAELDIVARRGRVLVAVEVKWRRGDPGGSEVGLSWRPRQRARSHAAMLTWMSGRGDTEGCDWRFDLITIEERADGWTLTHRPGAWSPGGSFW